jgi:hypothetical protein
VHQVYAHRENIEKSEQVPDVLSGSGYQYNKETFEDVFVKGFEETFIDRRLIDEESDSSDKELDDLDEEEKKQSFDGSQKTQLKKEPSRHSNHQQEDFEMIDTTENQKNGFS